MNFILDINEIAKNKILPCDVYLNNQRIPHFSSYLGGFHCCFEDQYAMIFDSEEIYFRYVKNKLTSRDRRVMIAYEDMDHVRFTIARTEKGVGNKLVLDIIIYMKMGYPVSSYQLETSAFSQVPELVKLLKAHHVHIEDILELHVRAIKKTCEDLKQELLQMYDDMKEKAGLCEQRKNDWKSI